ncbi:MAG: UDP-N-acetylglucosamine 2-epimerase (non-hydrolyzing) [Acidimicrobiia bacterium]|nr:UDP-N-acetylglucosamine 2-epimerase (non-hydrolyzing) [Acidimicrobiia bacterium]
MQDRSVAVVLGTRPEFVKLAPVVRSLGSSARVLHTGQHSTPQMSSSFLQPLGMPAPELLEPIAGLPRAQQIRRATTALVRAFTVARPALVVVQGDTNSTTAGALAANALGIPLAHVEAGLRSDDGNMPEERNRILADHLSELCCAPTDQAATRLKNEGISPARVLVTGNTVVDALNSCLPTRSARKAILASMGIASGAFILATFHRPENVDNDDRFAELMAILATLPILVVFPVHPRNAARLAKLGLDSTQGSLIRVDPLPYPDFLALEAECAFVISDSGGVQEEVSVLGRPVIVVRESTERPEVIGTFATLAQPGEIAAMANGLLKSLVRTHEQLAATPTPYGDGHSGERIVDALAALVRS